MSTFNQVSVSTHKRKSDDEEEYSDPFIRDDTILPNDLRIALEVENRILEYHHIAIDREKMFCHLAHLRIDDINCKIKALHEKGE